MARREKEMRDAERKWVWLLRWAARVAFLLGDEPIRRLQLASRETCDGACRAL